MATALLGAVARNLEEHGESTMSLRVDLEHAADAARLYDSLGFTEA
ncbi:MAG: hypothetical protein Q4P36_07205 [Bowdeniella nasicola]|nr:hypothetical protein [Bowdeniella nasicola]